MVEELYYMMECLCILVWGLLFLPFLVWFLLGFMKMDLFMSLKLRIISLYLKMHSFACFI